MAAETAAHAKFEPAHHVRCLHEIGGDGSETGGDYRYRSSRFTGVSADAAQDKPTPKPQTTMLCCSASGSVSIAIGMDEETVLPVTAAVNLVWVLAPRRVAIVSTM